MRIGVARELITPAHRTQMGGYNTRFGRTYDGVHDDLYARALLLEAEGERLLLLAADLLFYDAGLAERVKEHGAAKHGLRPEQVFVASTHTHGGPAVPGLESTGLPDAEYDRFLCDRLCGLVDRVFLNTFDGTLGHATIAGEWNINRRGHSDGRVSLRPNEAGPRDPGLTVLLARDADGRPRAILVNYGCHPVTVRDAPYLSAEFPGRICSLIEAQYYGCTALYFQGAGGNARPRVTARGDRFVAGDYDDIDDMAASIVRRLVQAVSSDRFTTVRPDLASTQFGVDIPITPHPISWLQAVADDQSTSEGTRYAVTRTIERYAEMGNHIRIPAGVARIGHDLHVAYLGGEPCYEIKQLLRPIFGRGEVVFLGYADSSAYIGDDKIISEGGYEGGDFAVRFGLKGPLAPGIDAVLTGAFAAHLDQLDTGAGVSNWDNVTDPPSG